jgi:Fe-S-cluster containining protein
MEQNLIHIAQFDKGWWVNMFHRSGCVDDKHVWDWNCVFLLYNYENLCPYLHKYLFTHLFSMCNYYVNRPSYHRFYAFIIYAKTFENQNFNSFHNSMLWNFLNFYNNCFSSSECVSQGSKHPLIYQRKEN